MTSIAISVRYSFCFPDFYEAIGLGKKWKYVLVIILLIPQLSPFAKLLGKHYVIQGRRNVFEHGEDRSFRNGPSSPF